MKGYTNWRNNHARLVSADITRNICEHAHMVLRCLEEGVYLEEALSRRCEHSLHVALGSSSLHTGRGTRKLGDLIRGTREAAAYCD